MIRTVQEFDEVADDLEFTEAHEKFMNFRKCLRDVAHDDWDTTKVGQVITIACISKATIYAWKLMILPEDIYEAQKNHIEIAKKPYKMTVHDSVKRIHQMASYLPEFPKPMAATALSDIDLKNIIFRGMPMAWQEHFVHANMRIASITLAQMTDYLTSEQVIAHARRDKNNKGRGSQGQEGRAEGRSHFALRRLRMTSQRKIVNANDFGISVYAFYRTSGHRLLEGNTLSIEDKRSERTSSVSFKADEEIQDFAIKSEKIPEEMQQCFLGWPSCQELTQSKNTNLCFYCIEARDNEDDMTMTIKIFLSDLLPHARNKAPQGYCNYTLNGVTRSRV
eukprot:scaffold185_cov42-Attheya_sp.AAC.7